MIKGQFRLISDRIQAKKPPCVIPLMFSGSSFQAVSNRRM